MGKKGLSHLQHKAIIELISTGNKSLKEIAQKVGVSMRTIRYWNHNPQFQEALSEAMEDLKKEAIDSSLFAVRIEAVTNMIKHEAEVVKNFDIKGAIVRLGERQALLERKIKENSEEMEKVKNKLSELKKELVDSGMGKA